MSGSHELRHKDAVSGRVRESEYEHLRQHILNDQAKGDIVLALTDTQLGAIPVDTNGMVLRLVDGFPTWVDLKTVLDYGLAFYGEITTAVSTTHFKVAAFAGLGVNVFKPTAGTPYEIYIWKADGAAPEGEYKPVVAFDSSDGDFQHAVFTAQTAVGDKILIIHPLLASLGTMETAAATGVVSTTKKMMAYVKQVVTLLLNSTYGLSAIKTLVGAKNATATADDLSDITTTDLAAKVRRLLLRFSAGAFSVPVDGSARTDLDALYTALGVLLGARADTPVVGFPGTNAALPILKGLQVWQGGFVYGDVTGYTDTKNFASTTLAGFETGLFNGWTCFWAKDNAGAGATPQGARVVIDTFTTTTGAILLKAALPSAGAVGDHIILVNPILLDAWNMRGGPRSLETLGEEQDAGLDVARGKYTKTTTGGEDDLYGESSDTEFVLQEFRVDLHNMAEGDTIVFKVLTTEDGTERQISNDEANTFTGPQDPARVEIIGSANQVWGREDISITATQTTGTNREIVCYWRDAKRGS